MITRSSIAFEDFLGSSIAPQVTPPWSILEPCRLFRMGEQIILHMFWLSWGQEMSILIILQIMMAAKVDVNECLYLDVCISWCQLFHSYLCPILYSHHRSLGDNNLHGNILGSGSMWAALLGCNAPGEVLSSNKEMTSSDNDIIIIDWWRW